jgi:hypothetical protein
MRASGSESRKHLAKIFCAIAHLDHVCRASLADGNGNGAKKTTSAMQNDIIEKLRNEQKRAITLSTLKKGALAYKPFKNDEIG